MSQIKTVAASQLDLNLEILFLVDALRRTRKPLASRQAEPGEIEVAAALLADYDEHFRTLRSDANLDLHFVHGVKVAAT